MEEYEKSRYQLEKKFPKFQEKIQKYDKITKCTPEMFLLMYQTTTQAHWRID
jgi:hypothetical protein